MNDKLVALKFHNCLRKKSGGPTEKPLDENQQQTQHTGCRVCEWNLGHVVRRQVLSPPCTAQQELNYCSTGLIFSDHTEGFHS